MPSAIIDELTRSFLDAIEAGGAHLALYSLLILALAGTIAYYREYAMVIMQGTGVGDALAGLLTYVMAALTYVWVASRLWEMGMAVLGTAIQWGTEVSGTTFSLANLRTPSFILDIGLKTAFPTLQFGTWWQKMWAMVQMTTTPIDSIIGWVIVACFVGVMLHHILMLIEFFLAMMCGYVLIPWGIWSFTAPLAEFGVGWFFGGFIRAFLSMVMVGIGTTLFTVLKPGGSVGTTADWWETLMRLVSAILFAVLCWQVPARAANRVGSATLGLTGHAMTAAAMGTARFGMMATGVGSAAVRGYSRMMAARRLAQAGTGP
jgi:type IV secretion system protein TrbL